MAPDFFEQEYKAERRNATGLDVRLLAASRSQCLLDAKAVKKFIPEWPAINPESAGDYRARQRARTIRSAR
jgi:hypothetical protein